LLVETGASLAKIAVAAGASKPTARRWKSGAATPRAEARRKLRDAFGIDPESWDTALPRGFQIDAPPPNRPGRPRKRAAVEPAKPTPRGGRPRKAAAAAEPAKAPSTKRAAAELERAPAKSTPAPRREIPPYPDPPAEGAGTVEDVRYLLVCIRHDLRFRDLTAAARSKLRSDEARTIALVAKLEAAEELKEDRYVRNHPAFRAHCDRILAALKPYPDAACAVSEALTLTN